MPKVTRYALSETGQLRNYPHLFRRYQRLIELSRSLSSTLDLPALLRQIIEAACEMTDSEAASILLVHPRTGELSFEASTQVDFVQMESIVVPKEGSIAGWIVARAQPLIIPDVRQDPRHFSQADEKLSFQTRSVLGVPLIHRGKVFGVLEAINKLDGEFDPDDVSTLETLASQAAVAIENARLFQQARRRNDYLAAAAEVGRLATSTLDVDALLEIGRASCRERVYVLV